jgi:hypothetical protein
VSGNTTLAKKRLAGQRIEAFRSWGKHFLVELPDFSLRVHFMLFGSYRINEARRDGAAPGAGIRRGEINFYACSVRFIEEPLDLVYDWWADVMSEHWDDKLALRACARARARWCATRCWTRTSSPAWATSSRTRCCSASACIRCPPSARCPRPSCASWCARRASTASTSTSGRSSSC